MSKRKYQIQQYRIYVQRKQDLNTSRNLSTRRTHRKVNKQSAYLITNKKAQNSQSKTSYSMANTCNHNARQTSISLEL